jgi:hypothetical protein
MAARPIMLRAPLAEVVGAPYKTEQWISEGTATGALQVPEVAAQILLNGMRWISACRRPA